MDCPHISHQIDNNIISICFVLHHHHVQRHVALLGEADIVRSTSEKVSRPPHWAGMINERNGGQTFHRCGDVNSWRISEVFSTRARAHQLYSFSASCIVSIFGLYSPIDLLRFYGGQLIYQTWGWYISVILSSFRQVYPIPISAHVRASS